MKLKEEVLVDYGAMEAKLYSQHQLPQTVVVAVTVWLTGHVS